MNYQLLINDVDQWNQWRQRHAFVPIDLSGIDLSGAYLFEADLSGVNLLGANLQRACLIGANLNGAILLGANLQGAYANDANFQCADLRRARLAGSRFQSTDLSYADLFEAETADADFSRANLIGTCLARRPQTMPYLVGRQIVSGRILLRPQVPRFSRVGAAQTGVAAYRRLPAAPTVKSVQKASFCSQIAQSVA